MLGLPNINDFKLQNLDVLLLSVKVNYFLNKNLRFELIYKDFTEKSLHFIKDKLIFLKFIYYNNKKST